MRAATLALLVVCGACASDSPGSGEPDASPATDTVSSDEQTADGTAPEPLTYTPCSLAEGVGGFTITLAEDYTGVSGQVLGGVVPKDVATVAVEAAECRLLEAPILFCDPPCVPGEACDKDGSCITYPESHSVGLVQVSGLKSPLEMDAKWGNHYTNPGTMEHPGFEEGAELSLVAAGGDFEAFALQGVGVRAMEALASTVTVRADEELELTWKPANDPGPTRIRIEMNINNHGANTAWISCDVEDTGSFAVSAELVSELFEKGVSGFPSIDLTRRSADSVTIGAGCVEFIVASTTGLSVDVEGVKSCTNDGQCPQGESCGVDLQCK